MSLKSIRHYMENKFLSEKRKMFCLVYISDNFSMWVDDRGYDWTYADSIRRAQSSDYISAYFQLKLKKLKLNKKRKREKK